MVPAKPDVPPPVHEDWNETVEPVVSWAEESAPAAAPAFGVAAVQEDWVAQVNDVNIYLLLLWLNTITTPIKELVAYP